jgi:hypothetical protein
VLCGLGLGLQLGALTAASVCAQVCLETVPHCLTKGGKHSEADHILLLHNCAHMCATSAGFMTAGLEVSGRGAR